jgi:hypothetical protein
MGETQDFPEPRDAGPDRRDNVASAGLDPDTWDELEAWRTERRLKRSEATRRLIRAGLDADTDDRLRDRFALSVFALGVTGYPAAAAHFGRPQVAAAFVVVVAALPLLRPYLPAPNDLLPWRD